MGKMNVAELLKDCPKGMELDCTVYDNVILESVIDWVFPIRLKTKDDSKSFNLTKYGCTSENENAKCVIFPKGKTTWEGFVPPCKFKDGDVIFTHANCLKVGLGNTWISIFQEKRNGGVATYVDMSEDGEDYYDNIDGDKGLLCMDKDIMRQRLATEEEKQKLFDAIREKGYHWNTESKTLEKLVEPKFKIEKGKWYVCIKDLLDNYANKAFCKDDIYLSTQDGSLIPSNSNVPLKVFCPTTYFRDWTIQDANDGDVIFYDSGWTCIFKCIHGIWFSSYCFITHDGEFHTGYEEHAVDATINGNAHLATQEQCDRLFQKMEEAGYKWDPNTKTLVELPKFKVGDIIRTKKGAATPLSNIIITEVNEYSYNGVIGSTTNPAHINFKYQDQYELVPRKFDISSLKPFDRVLVRSDNKHRWATQFFERLNNVLKDSFVCVGGYRYHQCIPYEGNEYLLDTANECKEYFRTWEKS